MTNGANQVRKIIEDEKTGISRRLSADVRIAAQGYSNIAGVLAGFAFTVIVLVVQMNDTSASAAAIAISRNISTVGFLAAFFGCVLSAFSFSLLASEEALTPRAHNMALFAGAGFSIAMSLLFWSLAVLLRTFLLNEAADLAYQVFPLFVIIHPAYVAASVLDSIYIFEIRRPNIKEILSVLAPSYLLLLTALLCRLFRFSVDIRASTSFFSLIIWTSILAIIINSILAAIFSAIDEKYRINLKSIGVWMGLQSVIICLLVISI